MNVQNKFAEMNQVLEEMRSQLLEGEEAWGPDSEVGGDRSGGKPGESGATNNSNVWDTFDFYVMEMVDDLLDLYEISEDEALDFIFSIADDLAAEGKMPPVPEDDDEQAVSKWLGVAGTIGFERMVLDAADEEAEGSEE